MEVILLERIEKLGQMGDVVTVKTGFARNFLLPQKKAMRLTDENKAIFEQQRAQLEAESLQRKTEADSVAGKLDGSDFTVIRQAGDSGQLYGSVSARDIANTVTEGGFTINRSQVVIDQAIKALGLYPVRIALHPEVSVTVTVNVARTEEEAKLQLERGGAITDAEEAADAAAEALAAAEAALAVADDTEGEVAAAAELVEDEVAQRLADEAAERNTDEAAEGDPAVTGDEGNTTP